MDEPARTANVAPKPEARGRTPQIFAIVSLVVALAAGGLYLFTRPAAPVQLSPEETVKEFLSSVFLAGDAERVDAVVCSNWDPLDAISRTTREIDKDAHVSWDTITVVNSSEDRVSATARLGLRYRDDTRPSVFRQWRFNLVDEQGWRVCDARPFP